MRKDRGESEIELASFSWEVSVVLRFEEEEEVVVAGNSLGIVVVRWRRQLSDFVSIVTVFSRSSSSWGNESISSDCPLSISESSSVSRRCSFVTAVSAPKCLSSASEGASVVGESTGEASGEETPLPIPLSSSEFSDVSNSLGFIILKFMSSVSFP